MNRKVKPAAVILGVIFGLLAVTFAQDVPPPRKGPPGKGPPPKDGKGPPGKDGKGKGKGPGKGGGATAYGPKEHPFQTLWIPPLATGKNIDLALGASKKSFWAGATTNTYGFNNANFWGPTLILNHGEAVQLKVRNNLKEVTTVHWHGLHLPAAMDGGPHQMIQPGATWISSFVVKNNAATYWYHPHPHELTQKQLTYGAGGLIIIRDPVEAKLDLPRTYGVDDLPLVFTSRRFDKDDQFTHNGDSDKYGDYLLANGTLDAQINLPAQIVRLRILNAEIERGYILGFPDNREFHLIATDGGLVDKPIALKRLPLMVGERVELLVDLSKDKPGSSLDLMAYTAGQPFGFPGGEPDRGAPNGSLLNNSDFRLLHINIAAPTAKAITKLPQKLAQNRFPAAADASAKWSMRIERSGPPEREFAFDRKYFDMHVINHVVKLGSIEAWTIANDRTFGHSFHVHDVQFKIVARSDGPIPDHEQGWKDTLYLPRDQSATIVARFDDFASDGDPFMYHCHMANHEDGGLMGQFLVSKNPPAIKKNTLGVIEFRNRVEHPLTPQMLAAAESRAGNPAPHFSVADVNGENLTMASLSADRPLALFFIEKECPCSREAAPFLDRLQAEFGDSVTVVGVINATPEIARTWARQVGVRFKIVADPDLSIIRDYGAEQSVYTTLIAPGGRVIKTYPGYSGPMLRELSESIAGLTSTQTPVFPIENAPEILTTGCPFSAGSGNKQ